MDLEKMRIAECGMRNKNRRGDYAMENKDTDLKKRTKQFALKIIKLVEELPSNRTINILARQLLRAGTSVGANYRSACRARSRADFISKMGIVEEEADETSYWLELLVESKLINKDQVEYLLEEVDEIIAIIVASINTSRKNQR